MEFRRVEVTSLGNHMVYPGLSHPSYELDRTISYSNLTIYKHWNEEKNTYKVYKWIFQIVIAKNVSITCIWISSIYLVALFTCLFLLYSNVHKKQAFKCLFELSL